MPALLNLVVALSPLTYSNATNLDVEQDEVLCESKWREYASVTSALLRLGAAEEAWDRLGRMGDPRLQTYFISSAAHRRLDHSLLLDRLYATSDPNVQFVILLALTSYDEASFTQDQSNKFVDWLKNSYKTHPDAGIHNAIRWILKRRKEDTWLADANQALIGPPSPTRHWFVNSVGMTMLLIPGEDNVVQYGDLTDAQFDSRQASAWRTVSWTYAISADEVTWDDFMRFDPAFRTPFAAEYSSGGSYPVFGVTASQALEYCRWVTAEDGIPSADQAVTPGQRAAEFSVDPRRPGYRLPGELEWERACRGMTSTSRFFGSRQTPVPERYIYFRAKGAQPVGQLLPNRHGLFDTLGNLREWTIDELLTGDGQRTGGPLPLVRSIGPNTRLATLGGSWECHAEECHVKSRYPQLAGFGRPGIGIRLVRTVPHFPKAQ